MYDLNAKCALPSKAHVIPVPQALILNHPVSSLLVYWSDMGIKQPDTRTCESNLLLLVLCWAFSNGFLGNAQHLVLRDAAAAALGVNPDALREHGASSAPSVLGAAEAAALCPCAAAGGAAAIQCGAMACTAAAPGSGGHNNDADVDAFNIVAFEGCAHAMHTLASPTCAAVGWCRYTPG